MLLVIDDDRMFRESEVRAGCDLGQAGRPGRRFAFDKTFRKACAFLVRMASGPTRKH